MKTRICVLVLLIVFSLISGCKTKPQRVGKDYDRALLPGENALRKITNPYEIPDFTFGCMDLSNLSFAVDRSLNYLSKPSSKGFFPISGISHERAITSLRVFSELLESGVSGPELNDAIRTRFDVYTSVGCDNNGTVLFTGYYTPILEGSFEPSERYRYPLYKQPEDLVKGVNGEILGRKTTTGTVIKYPSRNEIEQSGMLKGTELIWLADPFEAYIAHVQGSAKVRLPDGKLVTVGYAANNGHEYRSISKQLVSDGKITKSQMSLSAMIEYFKNNPDQVISYVGLNPRFVFFRIEDGAPRGSLNEPVTAFRSIATDKSIFPRGCLAFIATELPRPMGNMISQQVFSGFVLDQDTGGAIRAPGRCDVYMGEGDMAGRLAGQTYREGRLYYLFLKE